MGPLSARFLRSVCLPASFLVLSAFAWAQQPLVPPRIVDRIDEAKRTVLHGNTHPLARPQFDRGAAPPDLPMKRMLLVLKRSPDQERALLSLLDDQQDKGSSNYHKWLTPEKFGQQFGPADQDIQTITTWLQSQGFQIGNVAKGKNIIEFSGVARQVQAAFHTSIHKYVVNGKEHWANANDPEIPSALTPVVAGVHTLHNFVKKPMIHVAEQKIQGQLVQGKDGKPHVTFPGTPPMHALGPADLATIYNANPLYHAAPAIDGTGVVIAVVGRTDLFGSGADVADFRSAFGQTGGVNPYINGDDPGDLGGGEEVEATLDATWAGALAPNAVVDFVASSSTNTTDGLDLSEAYIIDNNLGSVMTESFGACEANFTSGQASGVSTLAEQAAAQGITYLVAAGDSGAEGCSNPSLVTVASGDPSVNILASTPFNLAVGGTMFNEDGLDSRYWSSTNDPATGASALSYIPESVWNESCLASVCGDAAGIWAAGGGASSFFTKPSWQAGVSGIPNDGWRDVPDVSLTAAGHDPYLLCLESSCVPNNGSITLYAVSGTSASAPGFAGIMALVDQKMGGGQGQAGYVLYRLAAAESFGQCNGSNTAGLPANTCVFNDVTVGNNAVPGEKNYGEPDAQYQSSPGYDLATGLGSVNVTNLVNKWNTVAFRPTTTTIVSVSPTTITHGQPVDITVTVAPNSGSGTPSGDISLLTSNHLGLGVSALSNGSISPTVSSLPGGTYTLAARYAGDGTFASSTSAPSPSITVSSEPSTTTLSAFTLDSKNNFIPYSGGPYGEFVYLQATVKGQSGQGTPTGSVGLLDSDFADMNFQLVLNNQGTAATPNFFNSIPNSIPAGLFDLPAGPHSVVANYIFGDQSFQPSVSAPLEFTIIQAPTRIVATPAPSEDGALLGATINTNSGGGGLGGTISFYVNGKLVGEQTADSGQPSVSPSGALIPVLGQSFFDAPLANGSYTFKAVYNGDQNYLPSTSADVKFTLVPDFVFASDGDTINVPTHGGTGSITLTTMVVGGYKGAITFSASSCSGLPKGANCSFDPPAIPNTGFTVLSVDTSGAAHAMLRPVVPSHQLWWLASVGAGLAGMVLIGVPSRRRPNVFLAAILCTSILVGMGCGGGGGSPTNAPPPAPPPPPTPAPAGTYTIVVKAVSGSLSHSLKLTLNIP